MVGYVVRPSLLTRRLDQLRPPPTKAPTHPPTRPPTHLLRRLPHAPLAVHEPLGRRLPRRRLQPREEPRLVLGRHEARALVERPVVTQLAVRRPAERVEEDLGAGQRRGERVHEAGAVRLDAQGAEVDPGLLPQRPQRLLVVQGVHGLADDGLGGRRRVVGRAAQPRDEVGLPGRAPHEVGAAVEVRHGVLCVLGFGG